jgi:hypothetical protein
MLRTLMEFFGISRGMTLTVLFLVTGFVSAAIYFFVRSAPPRKIIMTTGPEGSMFYTNAARYASILARNGVTLQVLTSHGSIENLNRLVDDSFKVDVGFVQGGVTNPAISKVVSLGSISYQPLLIFYRGEAVELLSGLGGKRVAIGPEGSGTRGLALTLLEANGIKPGGTTTILDWEPLESSKALKEGKVDAAFLMGEDASPTVMRELLRAPDIRLYSFKQATGYTRRYSYLSVLGLPQGVIDFGRNLPTEDVFLIGPTVELIARKHLHPALSDLLLEAAQEVNGRATVLQRKGEFPAPLEHDFRISADAARFYKSGKGFFYRYLPFWLASLTSRIVVVFVPMVVVLIPLLRSIPPVFRWRARSRIFRWYRALLSLERELVTEPDGSRREELLKELDEIESAVNRMKVPASFADQFYALRTDIEFVRRLREQRTRPGE